MRLFYKILPILFLIINMTALQSQTLETKLDQVELMKQFIGNWTCEYQTDTFLHVVNTPFGTGMVSNSHIVSNGETLDSIVQLFGYDKLNDRYIMTELVQSSSVLEICYAKFISNTEGELVVTNTDNAKFTWRFEFKNPDLIVQQAILDDKVIKEVTLTRVISNQ